jgi:hypothetical protein
MALLQTISNFAASPIYLQLLAHQQAVPACLSNVGKLNADNFENNMLNIDAFWSKMNPTAMLRPAKPVPRGEQLFLAWLWISGLKQKDLNVHRDGLRTLDDCIFNDEGQ